jgi:hypothetical protein
MVRIEVYGSFGPHRMMETCAEEGGHVAAIKRGIAFLTNELGNAVRLDAQLAVEGEAPPKCRLGDDLTPGRR